MFELSRVSRDTADPGDQTATAQVIGSKTVYVEPIHQVGAAILVGLACHSRLGRGKYGVGNCQFPRCVAHGDILSASSSPFREGGPSIDNQVPSVQSGTVTEQRAALANGESGHHVQRPVEAGVIQQQEIRRIRGRVDGQVANAQRIGIIEGRPVIDRQRLVAAVGEHDVLIERGGFAQGPIWFFPIATRCFGPDVRAVLIGAV